MSSEATDEEPAHDPDRFPLAGDDGDDAGQDPAGAAGDRSGTGGSDVSDRDGLGPRGWVLVGVLMFSFFVVPVVIVYRPPALPFEVAFLVLPLLPAFLLGGTAVWAMAGRAEE